jgi:hypothetical protein
MFLSLVVWVGGIIFFSFVEAPTAFRLAPSRQIAGTIVGTSLSVLHWIGLFSGVIFLGSSMLYTSLTTGSARPLAVRHVVVFAMLLLTLISQFGVSQVVVTFDDGTDVYLVRQIINERLSSLQMPPGIPRPELGPVATGLGEVFHYMLVPDEAPGHDLMGLRRIQDWEIKPALRIIPGAVHGPIAGVRDAHVGRALALLHGDPAKPWTAVVDAPNVPIDKSKEPLVEKGPKLHADGHAGLR